jgi:DNA-binding transcriptional LysR family regulator
MELRQLRYFVAVAETLNFSRAAERLNISQSSLSQQISALEKQMGVELFRRDKRSVAITEAGKAILYRSKNLLKNAERLVPEARGAAQSEHLDNDIFIGIDHNVDISHCSNFRIALTDAIQETRNSIQGLRPEFKLFYYDELIREIDVGTTDLAFFFHHDKSVVSNNETISQVCRKDEMVLVFRSEEELPDTPDTIRKILKSRGLVLLDRETLGTARILRILEEVECEPSIHVRESRSAMIMTAEACGYATILPFLTANCLRRPGLRIIHFGTPAACRYLLAVYRKDSHNRLIQPILKRLAEKL